jgi:predicted thioredoxin/glutaredoxin
VQAHLQHGQNSGVQQSSSQFPYVTKKRIMIHVACARLPFVLFLTLSNFVISTPIVLIRVESTSMSYVPSRMMERTRQGGTKRMLKHQSEPS